MLRERIEGKWIASFRRFLTLNGVKQGSQIAIVAGADRMTALIVSNVLLWLLVIGLALTVFALTRQIGVLYERVAPAGAHGP